LNRLLCLLTPLLLTLTASSVLAEPGVIRRAGKPVAGRYIVVLDSSKVPGAATTADEISSRLNISKTYIYDSVYKAFAFVGDEAHALEVSRDPRVRWVQEDSVISADGVNQTPAPSWGLDRSDQIGPVTLDFGGNWVPGSYAADYTGAGTVIYVIDSGIHPVSSEFGSRIREAHNWANGPGNVFDINYTDDCYGHGTRVASAAAGTTYGIAKDAAIVNLRVLDCVNHYTSSSTVIDAINWMVNDHNSNHAAEPAVANISLGSDRGTDSALDLAALNAVQNGITVVTSAGNDGIDACTRSPARAGSASSFTVQQNPTGASVITAAATERNDAFANSYSNYGSCVDILAPGFSFT
jgi:subtilisin family serine protease